MAKAPALFYPFYINQTDCSSEHGRASGSSLATGSIICKWAWNMGVGVHIYFVQWRGREILWMGRKTLNMLFTYKSTLTEILEILYRPRVSTDSITAYTVSYYEQHLRQRFDSFHAHAYIRSKDSINLNSMLLHEWHEWKRNVSHISL